MATKLFQVGRANSCRVIGIVLCIMGSLSMGTSMASAATIELTKYVGVYPNASFDGSDAVGAGAFNSLDNLDIDQSANVLYAASNGFIYKFDLAGVSQPFSALGGNTVFSQPIGSFGDLEVDNSPTTTQGRVYAFAESGGVKGWQPSGEPLGAPYPSGGITGFSDNCGAAVGPDGDIWVMDFPGHVEEYDISGVATEHAFSLSVPGTSMNACDFEMDGNGNFYVPIRYQGGPVYKFDPSGAMVGQVDPGPARTVAIDSSNNDVYVDDGDRVNHYSPSGSLLDSFGLAEGPPSGYPGLEASFGIAVDADTHKVYVANKRFPRRIDVFTPSGPIKIPDVSAGAVTEISSSGATLHGVINPDGVDTTDCQFVYGIGTSYDHTTPCEVVGVPTTVFPGGSGDNAVTAKLTGLTKGSEYHVKLTGLNGNGVTSKSNDVSFSASDPPVLDGESVSKVTADSAQLNVDINPEGGITTYRFEWGTDESYGDSAPVPDGEVGSVAEVESVSVVANGLAPGTSYHYRVVASNDGGEVVGDDHTFTTFAPSLDQKDTCTNAHVRQQTGAAQLLDCRAYEMVSAADTGGYNVESSLEVGQTPFGDYPTADGPRVLYGIHSGAIPGPWNPTNHGLDPYVASRTPDGWTTEYVGIPANLTGAGASFGSPLLEADPSLNTFAFGGSDICTPCFADGSTNIPLRMPDGSVIKGMSGSLAPAADTTGRIVKHFSADGTHFVFGSTAQFEPDANSTGIDTTIYDRNLDSDTTQVISTLTNGTTIADGAGVAELDISRNGSRIIIGRLLSVDAKGNHYYHLYMHVGSSPDSIDLTPGATSGALYGGMSGDGSQVYFTSRDPLTTSSDPDTDASADLFRAEVSSSGAILSRVSFDPSSGPGGPGDTNSCDPSSTTANQHWNSVDGLEDCSVTAIAGGGGVAVDTGDIYFLSPEVLDTSVSPGPIMNAPNLYFSRVGQPPHFVATLDSSLTGPVEPARQYKFSGSFGSFDIPTGVATAPNGDVYVYEVGGNNPKVQRFTPDGTLLGTVANGMTTDPSEEVTGDGLPGSLAVDPSNGDLYIPEFFSTILHYNNAGEQLEDINGPFGGTSAIGVNPSTHTLYAAANGTCCGFSPVFGTGPGPTYKFPEESRPYPRAMAFDAKGRLYVGTRMGTFLYNDKGNIERLVDPRVAFGVAVDPTDNSVYLSLGDQITHYTATGVAALTVEAEGLTASRGLAIGQNERLYVVQSGENGEVRYYDKQVASSLQTDNPAVIHATNDADTRHTEDLQVSPDGSYAVFSSTRPLTGFTSRGHSEIFRYEAHGDRIDCASCPNTDGAPAYDTTLLANGLGLSDDGKVFYDSREPLVLRDTNERIDAYEWESGKIELISTGVSPFNSRLLGASADGTDAYFFTRDTLVPQDLNGTLTKIYDARAGTGYPYIPEPPPCRASDECHGAGSPTPGQLAIGTIAGTNGNHSQISKGKHRCRRNQVRKGGRCVAKHRQGKRGGKRGGHGGVK